MDEFHRVIRKPKNQDSNKRKHTDKKKIRDLQRFLDQPSLPDEIKEKKVKELKELKKQAKYKEEAQRFELRYKKVKFIEKRKVIRKLEAVKKQLQSDPSDSNLLDQKKEW